MRKLEEKILIYIKKETESLIKEDKYDNCGIDTEAISWEFKKDRANISRIVNNLWKQGYLVKINGRPVFYLDYISLKKQFPNTIIPTFLKRGDKLSNYIFNTFEDKTNTIHDSQGLDNIIGANGSLSSQIKKAKAAVCYPPYGLNTIIFGHVGTEKRQIAIDMVNYAISNNQRNSNSLYYLIDCQSYTDHQAFETLLIGDNSSKGLLEKSRVHFLIFENIEYLNTSSLRMLGSLLNHCFIIKNNKQIDLRCMCIITTNLNLEHIIIEPISTCCPIKIELNDIDLRGSYEKMELVMHIFLSEAISINRTLKVSKDVLYALVNAKHKLNIIDLKNQIKMTCSNAFLENITYDSNDVKINLYHLPQKILQMKSSDFVVDKYPNTSLAMIESEYVLFGNDGKSNDFELYKDFPKKSATHLFSQFINEFNYDFSDLSNIDSYASENISCLTSLDKNQIMLLKRNIDPFVYQTTVSVLFKYPKYTKLKEHEELLYGILLHISNSILRTTNEKKKEIQSLENIYPQEYKVAKEIMDILYHHYHLETDYREINFLTNYIVIANQWANQTKVAILVIAHGESIATQMVNYVKNNISGDYFLDAIDFKEDLQLNDCMELACYKAVQLNQGSGVLVLCDKEPLYSISDFISNQTSIPSKTIHNLSLPLLIDLVNKTTSSICDLNTLIINEEINENVSLNKHPNRFIENITKRVISKTLNFLDSEKAVNILSECLNRTLESLQIPFSNDIAAKYLCHCSNMIERVIKKEVWQNQRANKFTRNYPELIQIVENSLELVNKSFDVVIPKNELVYITEIFIPYIEEKEMLLKQ